jgi:Ni/Co efflux regulator RcnB
MIRILLTAIAISLIAPMATADAASSKKRRSYEYDRQYGNYRAWQAPAGLRRGPPWAMPNECFTDEGYGRWAPCGGRDR